MDKEQISRAREIIASYKDIWWGHDPLMGEYLNHASSGWPAALDEIERLSNALEYIFHADHNPDITKSMMAECAREALKTQ